MFATLYLNLDSLHFQPLALWVRMVPPLVLAAGILGALYKKNPLKAVGWFGVFLFAVVATVLSFPGEDYVLGHMPGSTSAGPMEVGALNIGIRLLAGLAMTIALIITYRRLEPASETHNPRR